MVNRRMLTEQAEYLVYLRPGETHGSGAIGSHLVVQSDADAGRTAGAGHLGAGRAGARVAGREDGCGEDVDGEFCSREGEVKLTGQILYALSPFISFSITGALKASQAALQEKTAM